MKKYLLCLFILIVFDLKADLVLGMHAKGDTLAVVYKQSLQLFSISKVKTILIHDLAKDTAVINNLSRLSGSLYSIKKSEQGALKSSITKFKILNVTFHQSDLIVGVSFYVKEQNSPLCFGLVQLDSALNYKSLCLFENKKKNYLRILPFYPLEINKGHIVLPEYDSSKLIISKYFLDFKNHKLFKTSTINREAYKGTSLTIDTIKMTYDAPYLYSLEGLNYQLFFQFPLPIVFKGNNMLYNNSSVLNYNMKDPIHKVYGDGSYLHFKQQIKQDPLTLLTNTHWNDSLFYLFTELDTNRVTLIYESIKYHQYTYRSYKINPRDKYFFIQNYFLYAVTMNNGQINLVRYRIY